MKTRVRLLLDAFVEIFVAPIRSGRPRPREWPAGVAPVMALAGIGYLIGVLLVLGAPWLRAADRPVIIDGAEAIGSTSMTVLLWLVSLTLALGLTAALHVHPLLKLISIVVFLLPLSPQLALGTSPLAVLASLIGVVVFFVVRRRGSFASWEFPVIWILVSIAVMVPLIVKGNLGYDMRTSTVLVILAFVNALAVPALMMTGYAAAQVGVSFSQWMGLRLTQVLPNRVTLIATAALALGNLGYGAWSTYRGRPGWELENWLGSALLVVLTVIIIVGLLSGLPVRGVSRRDPADPDTLGDSWASQAFGLASVTLAFMLLTSVSAIAGGLADVLVGPQPDWLANLSTSNVLIFLVRIGQAALALWWGWKRARRGDRVTPVVLGAYCAIMIISALSLVTSWTWLAWEIEPAGVLILVIGALVWWTARGAAGAHHALILALLVTLFRFREPLSEPGMVFGAVSASAVLLISLLWRVLTDGDLMAGDSAALPQASRVLAFGTMTLLAVLILAVTAQMRIQTAAIDQSAMISLGDMTLGGALFMAAGLASVMALWASRHRDALIAGAIRHPR